MASGCFEVAIATREEAVPEDALFATCHDTSETCAGGAEDVRRRLWKAHPSTREPRRWR